MWCKARLTLSIVAILAATPPAHAAAYIMHMYESRLGGIGAPDVEITGSGTIDLTGLSLIACCTMHSPDIINPRGASITIGSQANFAHPASWYSVSEWSGPGGFGPGGQTLGWFGGGGGDGEGPWTGFDWGHIYVPQRYVSNTFISSEARYWPNSISALGATPGSYTWTYGPNDSTFTLNIDGAPGPIVGAGLPWLIFAGGFLAWRRRKR
jgi:hypothetical protein